MPVETILIPSSPVAVSLSSSGVEFTPNDLTTEEKMLLGLDGVGKDPERQLTPEQRKELEGFIPLWENRPESLVVEGMASYFVESERKPDPFVYVLDEEGILRDPKTGIGIVELVGRQQNSQPLGKADLEAVISLQDQASERVKLNEPSQILWISPLKKDVYPSSKLTVSEVKRIGNLTLVCSRSIILDNFFERDCVKLAQDIGASSNLGVEDIRSLTFLLDTKGEGWLEYLGRLVPDTQMQQAIEYIKSGEDIKNKEQALQEAATLYQKWFKDGKVLDKEKLIEGMRKSGMMGDRGSSCPPGSSGEKKSFGSFAEAEDAARKKGWTEKKNCKDCGKHRLVGGCGYCIECEQKY